MPHSSPAKNTLPVIGWREWISIPGLGIDPIKAKIDTGARTSALHAFNIEVFRRGGEDRVRFDVHPFQRDAKTTVSCEAHVVDDRLVRSSGGHISHRPVIRPEIQLMGGTWRIEVTLVSRDAMGFRMLLGREAVRRRFLIHPGSSYRGGVPDAVRKRRRKRTRKTPQAPARRGDTQ